MTALALLLAAWLQAEGRPAAPRNPVLEGVALQAGDGLVYLSEYERLLERTRSAQPAETPAERERQRVQLLRDVAILRLEEERGQDLGFDKAVIDRIRKANLDAVKDEKGLDGYLAELDRRGTDALADVSQGEQQLYRQLWERKARGLDFGATRATRDRGFRPGELRYFFEENRPNLERVRLRWLIVSSESKGGPEAARETCEDVRRRVLAGEDFGLLIEEHGVELRETLGLTPFVPLRALPDPTIAVFCQAAEEGDLSEVLPLVNPRSGKPDPGVGFQLVELDAREVPDFADPEVQRLLREVLEDRRSGYALGRARERLWGESYVWVNPLLGLAAPGSGPAPAP
jgi:hypothetical protein